jgi:hypothetical protein
MGGDPERRDPQVGRRVGGRRVGGAEETDERGGRGQDDDDHGGAEEQSEPDAVHALADGGLQVARAHPPGDRRSGGVGQEDEDADGGGEEGGGDAEPGELRGAEVADDGAVGHDEEGLRDQGAEGGNGQGDDLAVVPAPEALGGRGGLCHEHQSNRPQVRDAMCY